MKYTFCKFCGTYLQILANFQQKVRNTQKGKKNRVICNTIYIAS